MRWGRFLLPPQLVASSMLEAGRITAGRQAERGLGQGGKKGPSGARYISRRTPGSALSRGHGLGAFIPLCPHSDPVCAPPSLVFHARPTKILPKGKEAGKGWCECAGLRTYQESRCRGRGGSGCCFQHRCWALGPALHSAGCGFGLRPQCMRSTQTMVTSLLWVVGWDEVNRPGNP